MFLSPKKVFENGWLKGVSEENIQPNAIDIPINKIYKLINHNAFFLWKDRKAHRNRLELQTTTSWELGAGVYDFFSDAYVEMPEGVCGWLITRSTLNRNGILVHSGLYDSGYKGHINGTLYVFCDTNYIEPGACVAQFIMFSGDSVGKYAGGYNTIEGDIPQQVKESVIEKNLLI